MALWAIWGVAAGPIPSEWLEAYDRGDLLYSDQLIVQYMPEVGNGFLATVAGSHSLYIAGVFNGCLPSSDPARVARNETCHVNPSRRAQVPAPLLFSLAGASLSGSALDLRHGAFLRRFALAGASAELRLYAHRSRKSLLVLEVSASRSVSVNLLKPLEESLESEDFSFSRTRRRIGNQQLTVLVGIVLESELLSVPRTRIAMVFPDFFGPLLVGKSPRTFIAAIRTSLESEDPEAAAIADYEAAQEQLATDSLRGEHEAAWAKLWESGFEVAGRMDVARAVNASKYFLLSSIRSDVTHSISPGGLASNGYNGHSFWDCETWMYPSILLWHPELAASLLQYRLDRVGTAEQKALSYGKGYKGVMFPWESAATGAEECPSSATTGQFEQHITADILFAARQFWYTTGNRTWLQAAYPGLIKGSATFWMSRVRLNATDGTAHIDGVIPPDEYAFGNDSVYTNYAVKIGLLFATEAAQELGEVPDPQWADIANRLVLLFDPALNIHPEYHNYTGQKIKQADVVLLGFPFMMEMSAEVRKADLEYYANRTDSGGPAMTWAMHSVGFIELGNLALANPNFNRSFANVQAPFNVWTETPSGGTTNFLTGAGGFLQGITFGLFGLRVDSKKLAIQPTLLDGMSSIKLRGLHYLGAVLDLEYSAQGAVLLPRELASPLALSTEQGSQQLAADVPVEVPFGVPFRLRAATVEPLIQF